MSRGSAFLCQRIDVPCIVALVGEEQVRTIFGQPAFPFGSRSFLWRSIRGVVGQQSEGTPPLVTTFAHRDDGFVEELRSVNRYAECTGFLVHLKLSVPARVEKAAVFRVPGADLLSRFALERVQDTLAYDPLDLTRVTFVTQAPIE